MLINQQQEPTLPDRQPWATLGAGFDAACPFYKGGGTTLGARLESGFPPMPKPRASPEAPAGPACLPSSNLVQADPVCPPQAFPVPRFCFFHLIQNMWRKRRKKSHKEIFNFFFSPCKKIYHLIVGSSWVRDILASSGYEMHLQNQGSSG